MPHLRCATAPSAAEGARPRLRVQDPGHIDVECGDWTIEPLAVPSDPSAILSFRSGSSVVLAQGSVTFATKLEGVSISGTGSVKAENGIHESAVNLCGDLDVRGDVIACVIELNGDFEATGLVVLGTEPLMCNEATIHTAFATEGEVRCESLHVTEMIMGTGTIRASSLVCKGPICAQELIVAEHLDVGGTVDCELLRAEGSVRLANARQLIDHICWKPTFSKATISIPSDGSVLRSVEIATGARILLGLAVRLGHGSEIKHMRVRVPTLDIHVAHAVDDNSPDTAVPPEASLRLSVTHPHATIRVRRGHLRMRFDRAAIRTLRLDTTADATVAVAEGTEHVGVMRLTGRGEVSIEERSPDAQDRRRRLAAVNLVGPIRFWCRLDIARLTAKADDAARRFPGPPDEIDVPRLDLGNISVNQASGECVLEGLGARLRGHRRHGLTILGIEMRHGALTGGHLTNADVRYLPVDQIPHLSKLRVLELSGRSLKLFARDELVRIGSRWPPRRPLLLKARMSGHDVSDRSETAAELARLLVDRVTSGNSRAWLFWCVERLQHRSLETHGFEHLFRSAYRMVGYGFRPMPAVSTWVLMALLGLLWGLGIGAVETTIADQEGILSVITDTNPISADASLIGRYLEFLLYPISAVGFGASSGVLRLQPTSVDLIARVLIGIPFVFVVLSSKRFFRTQVDPKAR